ncbi:DUF3899 domain-containing protein [Bacillus sp. JJ1609]|uniref:DUF3899 domain-containing protein n=1 Tax=Bacillus sp. JJ1609 TaxID=3122977 RepID=UPI002FFF5D61
MSKGVGKILLGFLGSQVFVVVLSFLYYKNISLLNYINISFYITCVLLFTSLLVFTVNSGFFDAISFSFRTVFAGKENGERIKSIHEMTPLSEMVKINTNPILIVGLLDFVLMLGALSIYYL